MTTIRQFIQTGPAKANELFGQLLDTSEGAVKSREKIFAELKAELELVADLEERHLFPALRKHKETKDLVQDALDDNKQTRKLLAELERTPKDGENFTAKVVELRKVFQQHVRDDKKELLPAVLKALSDEEAAAVLASIEGQKAEIASAERAEAEQRRAEARQERKQAEDTERAAREAAKTVRASAEQAERMVRTTEDSVRSGFAQASQAAQQSTNRFAELLSDVGKQSQDAAEQARSDLKAVNESGAVLARGVQEVSREWIGMTQNQFQRNMDGFKALSQCRSLQALVAAQMSLFRDNLQLTLENGQRITQLSVELLDEAKRPITTRSAKADRSKRAA